MVPYLVLLLHAWAGRYFALLPFWLPPALFQIRILSPRFVSIYVSDQHSTNLQNHDRSKRQSFLHISFPFKIKPTDILLLRSRNHYPAEDGEGFTSHLCHLSPFWQVCFLLLPQGTFYSFLRLFIYSFRLWIQTVSPALVIQSHVQFSFFVGTRLYPAARKLISCST